jgi:hypothetical protein
MPYIDVKVTAWERLQYDEAADITKLIEVYQESGVGDLFQADLGYNEFEILLDTVEEMESPSDNAGSPIIEFYDSEGNLIYTA